MKVAPLYKLDDRRKELDERQTEDSDGYGLP